MTTICDCELSQNGIGLVGRECDCPPGMRAEIERLRAELKMTAQLNDDAGALIVKQRAERLRLREALEIIAGERPAPDNLLGNADIARIALHGK